MVQALRPSSDEARAGAGRGVRAFPTWISIPASGPYPAGPSSGAAAAVAGSGLVERMCWATGSQEAAVERFYGQGAADFGEFHGGYLNFGLWEKGVGSYLQAAENLVHRLGTLLGLTGSSRLLDVACGMGTQDVYLFDHFGQPEIDAIDITWDHLRHAEDRARRRGCGQRVRFRHGSAVAISFADGAFTQLLSIEGPVHFGTRERFFHETLRVLEPGGVLARRSEGKRAGTHHELANDAVPKPRIRRSPARCRVVAS